MKSKLIGTICFVLGIIIFVSSGTTFAYFSATANNTGDDISGNTMSFDVSLTPTTIKKATQLIPLEDNLITTAITKNSNKCIDKKGYEVCTLYELRLSNSGDPQILNGFIQTKTATYTTDNLKCQLFDSNYNPVSDIMTLSRGTDKTYFKKGSNYVTTDIEYNDVTYYLAIWLHETNQNQSEDYGKTFSGTIAFESINGNQIAAEFTS